MVDQGRKEKHTEFGRDEDVDTYLQTALLFRKILQQSGKGWRRVPSSLEGLIAEALWEEPLPESRAYAPYPNSCSRGI